MDKLIAYWRHIFHRIVNPIEESDQQPRKGERWEDYVARQPVHSKWMMKDGNGDRWVVVVRYLEMTGTWMTSYIRTADGHTVHRYGKTRKPKVKNGHRKRTISARQVR